MDALVLAILTLAESTGIQEDPSKRPIATLFLAMPPPPRVNLFNFMRRFQLC